MIHQIFITQVDVFQKVAGLSIVLLGLFIYIHQNVLITLIHQHVPGVLVLPNVISIVVHYTKRVEKLLYIKTLQRRPFKMDPVVLNHRLVRFPIRIHCKDERQLIKDTFDF